MTTFNQTITNSLNMFGPQDTNNWGVLVWGIDNWAYGAFDLPVTFYKVIFETMALDDSITTLFDAGMLINNSITLTGDMTDEYLIDRNGYYQVFDGGRNAETRPLTGYNSLSDTVTSYTQTADPGTSYTQIN